MAALLRLYPRRWRVRYQVELEDVLAQQPPGLSGSIDLLRGALDAHLHPDLVGSAVPERSAHQRWARRFGLATWLGAALWVAGWVIVANGPIVVDGNGEYRDGTSGAPFILIAAVLLAAGLVAHLTRLPGRSHVARAGAVGAIIITPIWGLAPWALPVGGGALVGIIAFALGAWRVGYWGQWAALAGLGSALGGTALAISTIVGWGVDLELVTVGAFTPIWIVVGGTLQRASRTVGTARACDSVLLP